MQKMFENRDMDENHLMELFLLSVNAFASSIDRAYINAWHEQYQQSKPS